MRPLDRYISVGSKRLRCGYTTGTCAAGAARAAAECLLGGEPPAALELETPSGVRVILEIERCERGEGWAACAVQKDGGDDPDVTDGLLVFARVGLCAQPGVSIDGGVGVGRVTRPGLDQPVGAAAINHVPREMIAGQLRQSASEHGYAGGFDVEVSIPGGDEVAEKTFNPRLGIVGGISVLGTSGIVKPMSEDALVSSLELEMRQLREEGLHDLLVAPGNYGRDFARDVLGLDISRCVQCSNYLGKTVQAAARMGYVSVLVVGHIGKLVKVAAGIANTHSRVADARRETLAAHAALAGAPRELVAQIMQSATTDEVIELLEHMGDGLKDAVMESVTEAIARQLAAWGQGACDVQAVMFSKAHGLLGKTLGADRLIGLHRNVSSGTVQADRKDRI